MDFAQTLAELTPDADVRTWVVEQFEIVNKKLAEERRQLAERDSKLAERDSKLAAQNTERHADKLKIQALTLELAHLRRMRFGQSSEAVAAVHYDLFDETAASDVAALEAEIDAVVEHAELNTVESAPNAPRAARSRFGRQRLPEHLARIEHRHELACCDCGQCGASLTVIGEDVSEQLDIEPARFLVHRHIRPQYACKACETVTAKPIPASVIDGGMAAPGLISWVLTSKFADHLPLYRLEQIAARSNVVLARSTLAEWVGRYGVALQPLTDRMRTLLKLRSVLHADETPVEQLAPGIGKTKRAYLWAYCSSELEQGSDSGTPEHASEHAPELAPIVVFDYQTSRAGVHARAFLNGWQGQLMCDDYSGYKALFEPVPNAYTGKLTKPIVELGCMAHARRKFFELHKANQSTIAFEAMRRIAALYDIERACKDMSVDARKQCRAEQAIPKLAEMKAWLTQTRGSTANGGALAKAIDYSLKRWDALSRYAHTGHCPIDNNAIENAIRPIAVGKKNWLFAGSERAGKRAAAIQSLFATAKRNELDPQKWLKDVIEKLPTWPNRRIDELLPFKGYRFG